MVPYKGETHFATGGHHIVELVEIALPLEGEFAVLGRSEINGGIGRGEEDISAAHRVGFEFEGDGVVVATASPTQSTGALGCNTGRGQRKVARPSAMPGRRPRRLTPGGFAEGGSATGELGIRHAHGCTRPGLGGDGAEGGHDAVVNVAHGDAVPCVVVPNGKHSAENGGITLFELLIADLRRCPFLIEHRAVEVIVVVTGGGDDVNIAVGDGDELIAWAFIFAGSA